MRLNDIINGKLSENQPESPLKQTFRFFGSMQLGIFLLLLLAGISAYATLQEMERAIDYIYSSWWYLSILSFTSLNLLLCTVQRIRPMFRLAYRPSKTSSGTDIRSMPVHREVLTKGHPSPLDTAAQAFKSVGLNVSVEDSSSGRVVFGERGSLGYFGSFVTHLSLLVILLGALYGVVTGYEVTNGGWIDSSFAVREGDFAVNITDIRMVQEKNPVMRPRVYTDVTVRRGEEVIAQDTVSINYPVRFGGNTIYHSTFLLFPVFKLTDVETGEAGSSRFMEGDRIYLDAHRTTHIEITKFYTNFSMRPDGTPYNVDYRTDRPVVGGLLWQGRENKGNVLLPLNKAQVFATPGGDVEVVLTGYDLATVFSVSKNLGRPFLFTGSLLLLLGLYMSFFITPERYYAVSGENDHSMLIGGRGYRSKLFIASTLQRIEADIKRREEAK